MKKFWKRKFPAYLLALALLASVIPSAAAASADLTYNVDAGGEIHLGADDFWDLFYDEWRGVDSLHYLEFTYAEDFDSFGYFSAEDGEGSTVRLYHDDLTDGLFYYSGRDASAWDEYDLDTLSFVSYSGVKSDSFSFRFTLYGAYELPVSGTMEVRINNGRGSSSDVELTYRVNPDDEVTVNANDFWNLFRDESRDSLYYLEFTDYDDFDDYGHFYAEDADMDDVNLYDSTLDDGFFYYDWREVYSSGEYDLGTLTFSADRNADQDTLAFDFTMWGEDGDRVYGTMYIEIGRSSGTKGDISYQVDAGSSVTFRREDFRTLFSRYSDDTIYRLEFTDASGLDDWGRLYSYDYNDDRVYFDEDDIGDGWFCYYDSDLYNSYDYTLDDLTFVADSDADGKTVTLDFTIYGEDDDRVYGSVSIEIGKNSGTQVDGDIVYEVDPDESVTFQREDFRDFFNRHSNDSIYRLEFTDASGLDDWGRLYSYDYENDRIYFDEDDIHDGWFYYYSGDLYNSYDYTLDDLTFVADRQADGEVVTLDFTIYGEDDDEVTGTVAIAIGDVSGASTEGGDIRYYTNYSGKVQINANDIARFFNESYPGYTLQYVSFTGAPSAGSLYYNYYGTSGSSLSYSLRITEDNCDDLDFYFSPSSSQYSLSELTYVPSGVNYCAAIPFIAYGTGSRSVSGTILISVNLDEVPDVYGPTPVNTSVSFPASSIYAAVSQSSGLGLTGIRLLELPAATVGTLYVGSGTSVRADTETLYTYSGGSQQMSQLRFVPASGYTGSVEIPYVAYSGDNAIASGKLCLGIVREMEDFSDIDSSTWCYKYVLELSDAGVIDGYEDGRFRPDNQVTYGAALKLIMLAAGYPEQAPTGSHVFSGYLSKAQEDGLVSGSVDLNASITRLAVSQIAAKAMKLSITNLSSVRPFTDTSDPYVQALNAAGIVEGYFDNGTSTFKPYNTLTRGQISAIVWRMEQAN